ncbi:peptidase domain-containing ABC transporter [Nonomuraea soli]|uniref:ABC-type bacteriocin/lantibiotic exporter with double-glycine peptidase domain n=1 Tax=Nonomuraea soli TaxID=1032476 RepID=A0A7W0CN92_9ACTN|nr:peptidase domain-containing ABC transporter [Nonomuraea soli]MBA2894319.1 ABC-type bacteriocin/lantibiotic exporter with double-glycine peptidase domain [Nonomuraea soli]
MARVPLRHQLTTTECAAACLAMIASFHGRDTRVAECRELLGIGRDGVSTAHLAAAGPKLGLHVRTERAEVPRTVEEPVIAFLTEQHFVVVERADARRVRIADPGSGRAWLSREDFERRYSGVVVRVTPQAGFVRRRTPVRDRLMIRYLRDFIAMPGSGPLLGAVVACAVVLKMLALVLPLATQQVVDSFAPGQRADVLPAFIAVVAGTTLIAGLMTLLRELAVLTLSVRAERVLGRQLIRHMLRLPLSFYIQRRRGDLLARLGSVSTTRESVSQRLLTTVLDLALLTGYLIGLALLAPGYLPVVLALAVTQMVMVVRVSPRVGAVYQRELTTKAEEQSYLTETLEAIVPVKANGAEPRAEHHWSGLLERYCGALIARSRITAVLDAVNQALATLTPLLLLLFGLVFVLSGQMTLGTALAANAVALAVLIPIQTLAGTGQSYPMLRSQIERVYDIVDAEEEPTGARRLPEGAASRVDVEGLTFHYQTDAPPVLHEVSFSVPAGSKLGIVGRTGSGKSTIALLVLGLLRPSGGVVRFDGHPLDDLDIHHLRSRCGAVLQDLNLFNGSIRDNLTLGRPDASDGDLVWSARIAGLHDDVLAMPMGYGTLVGEAGAALSAGQRQRVALARALIHRPRLLILDEATSHLDPDTERRVDAELSRLEVTRIVVSHRLSAIRDAHQILVLDQGRVCALGRHEELVTQGGVYTRLFAPHPNHPFQGTANRPAPIGQGAPHV